ncbi:hypothetical protein GCM10010271_45940 [Streptomyces kurssanovii]|nr:hypothetical protein GCM10010271_45940 [Streptomyces kurssanovii]
MPPCPKGYGGGAMPTDDNAAWGHLPCPEVYGRGACQGPRARPDPNERPW